MHGESCVITLSDDTQVFAPSGVSKRLNSMDKDKLDKHPAYIRPNGKKKSKKTGHEYCDFDLVKPPEPAKPRVYRPKRSHVYTE